MNFTKILYISYHNQDCNFVLQFADDLIANDIFVCLDRFAINPLDNWAQNLQNYRENAELAIIVVSQVYLDSNYCQRELQQFVAKQIPIYTVFIDDVPLNQIQGLAQNVDWFNFKQYSDAESYRASLDKLIQKLVADTGLQTRPSAEIKYLFKAMRKAEGFLLNMPFQYAALRAEHRLDSEIRPACHAASLFLLQGFYTLQMQDQLEQDNTSNELTITNLIEWLKVRSQLILAGVADCGKTSIAQHLMLYALHQRAQFGASVPLPVWIYAPNWHSELSLVNILQAILPIGCDETPLMLFIDDIDKLTPWQVDEVLEWLLKTDGTLIATARRTDKIRLSLATLTVPTLSDDVLRRLSKCYLPNRDAEKFTGQVQQNVSWGYNPSIYRSIEFLGWQMLLFQADKNDVPPVSPGEIIRQVITYLWRHADQKRLGRMTLERLESALQLFAFKVVTEDTDDDLSHRDILRSFGDDALIQLALEFGILDKVQGLFQFRSQAMQNYYAAQSLLHDGVYTRLSYPQFDTNGQYRSTRWDEVIQMLFYSIPTDAHGSMLESIAEVNPLLAASLVQHIPPLSNHLLQDIIRKLLNVRHYPDKAVRDALVNLHNLPVIQDTLVAIQRNGDWNTRQEAFSLLLELDIEVPNEVLEYIEQVDRTFPDAAFHMLEGYETSHFVSLLIILTTHPRDRIRRNAIWAMGQLQDKATVPALTLAIEDENQNVVQETVNALGLIADMETLPFVLRVANHPAAVVFSEVLQVLEDLEHPTLARLFTFLRQTQTTIEPDLIRLLVGVDDTLLTTIIIDSLPIDIRAKFGKDTVPTAQITGEDDMVKQLLEIISNHMQTLRNHEAFNDFVESLTNTPTNVQSVEQLKERIQGRKSREHVRMVKAPDTLSAAPVAAEIPKSLVQALHDEDWEVRQGAVLQLAGHDVNKTLPLLLQAAKDTDHQVRISALKALARLKDYPVALDAVVAALDDNDYLVLDTVSEILKLSGNGILYSVLRKLESASVDTLAATIDVLGAIGNDSIVPQLLSFLNDTRTPWVSEKTLRDITAQALVNIGTTTSLQAVHDANYVEKPETVVIIRPEVEPTAQRVSSQSRFTPAERIKLALRALRGDDWQQSQKAARYIREYAHRLRGTSDADVINPLLDALTDKNWVVRWTATEALAWLKNSNTETYLVKRLADASWIVRVAAIRALVELEARNSATLIARLIQDSQNTVREAVVEAIGILRNRSVVPILRQAVDDDDAFVRLAAVQAIISLMDKDAVPLILHKMHDSYNHVRWATIQHLAKYPHGVGLEHFEAALNDWDGPQWEEKTVSDYAVEALERIGNHASKTLLDTWKQSHLSHD